MNCAFERPVLLAPSDTRVRSALRAWQCGHVKVAKHLIDGGADVNTSIKSGASALYTACFRVRGQLPPRPTARTCAACRARATRAVMHY